MQRHFDKVQDLIGFASENAKGGETVKILTRASLTSDEPDFYTFIEQISSIFLESAGLMTNAVNQFLVLIHKDLSADMYVNSFKVAVEVNPKRDLQAGEIVRQNDIADMRRLSFPEINIAETDKVIYCFKVGWKFGLFFDLDRPDRLNLDGMSLALGQLHRYLSFQYVYKVLESEAQFQEMTQDGWFPFVEIVGGEYKKLSEAYQNKFDFENKTKTIVDGFGEERIKRITGKWWKNQIFSDKKSLIEAGINAYLQDNQDGFVNCIKTLSTEIEGIIRIQYFTESGKGKDVKMAELLNYIREKGKVKSGSEFSLFLPMPFFTYLKNVIFADFDLENGKLDLSRHTSSHGVAKAGDYTRTRALQLILVLDQLYFYI